MVSYSFYARPNKPCGRHINIKAMVAYTAMEAKSGISTLPKVSARPMIMAPTNAPFTDPIPPITTTTKEIISIWSPIPGYTELTGAPIMPANPANAAPALKTMA